MLEIARRHHLPVAVRVLARQLRTALQRDRPVADGARQRQQARGADGLDAWEFREPPPERAYGPDHIGVRRVRSDRQGGAHRQRVSRVEAEIDSTEFDETSHQQHGADEEDH
jgi:hypothetical protein